MYRPQSCRADKLQALELEETGLESQLHHLTTGYLKLIGFQKQDSGLSMKVQGVNLGSEHRKHQ